MVLYLQMGSATGTEDNVGIQASYWLTGSIVAVLGAIVARIILGFLGGVALAVGTFLLKAAITVFLVTVVLLMIWLVLRFARRRGARPA